MNNNLLNYFLPVAVSILLATTARAQQSDTLRHQVLIETSMGNIRMELYNETPRHRDNFLKLVRAGFYDGQLFHRVIFRFMIQAGDSASRHAQPGQTLGETVEPYTIPAEICYPKLFHVRGAVGAAREGDELNPGRASSSSQFYIVYGTRFNDEMLDKAQQRLDKATGGKVKITPEVREAYKTKGGTPHLDGQYTVFGHVTDGLDVVDAIQRVETDKNNRPLKDVRILRATIIK